MTVTIVPHVGLLPPHFRMAVIHALAAMFCMGLTENEDKAKLLSVTGDTYRRKARAQDAGQSTPRVLNTQQFLVTRRGIRSGNEGLI